jgi:hypothetical protein
MEVPWKSSRRVASALLLSVALAGCASGSTGSAPGLLQRIESASTRSDHEQLAAHYGQRAAAAREVAAEPRMLARGYPGAVERGQGGAGMLAQSNAIAHYQLAIAAQYEGMAAEHRQIAARPMFRARHERMRD